MILTTGPVFPQKAKITGLKWTVAAKLQDHGGKVSVGFAGAINGVNHQVLIVAGGANFPDKMPWDGGRKHYSDEIHVLQKSARGFKWIKQSAAKLPEPIAYCGNTSTPAGIVYVGGENQNGLSNRAYLLNWNANTSKVSVKKLPNLPLALTNTAATHVGQMVYVVGGDGKQESSAAFFCIDLGRPNPQWLTLPNLPVALANAVVVAQKEQVYVIGGRTKTESGISILRNSTFVYNPHKQSWKPCAAISDGEKTTNFSAGAGIAIADHFILLAGGDNGEVFHQIEQYIVQIAKTKNAEEKSRLLKAKNELSTAHKGFYKGMLLYNTLKNSWTKIGELPFPAQVTTTATLWDGNVILSSGEVKPGVRTPEIRLGRIE